MKRGLLVVKLGGSVVTFKNSSRPKARITVIQRLAEEIKQLVETHEYRLILVHGAGSFGHPLAKKYGLFRGMKTKKQKLGFGLTDQKMIELNSLIVSALLKNQVPAVGLPPRAFITQTAGKLESFDYSLIQAYLQEGIVPVLFGDVVLDTQWGCSVISGDTIIPYLSKQLQADKVIFLSDVDGIFDSDPKKNPEAKLIKEINDENIAQVLEGITANNSHDVTGEMQGKIVKLKNSLRGSKIFILNGLRSKSLKQAIEEHKRVGTCLLFGQQDSRKNGTRVLWDKYQKLD